MEQPKNTGRFGKGNPGKPKGAKNKTTMALKEMVLSALAEAGGVDYLVRLAHENQSAFTSLLGKVLPTQVTGDAENPLRSHMVVELVGTDPAP